MRYSDAAALMTEVFDEKITHDFVERMLGRKPVTLRAWLQEHAKLLLG